MGGCARAAPALLRHVTLWLMAYSGACLVTSARVRWDPSTYVVVRLVAPAEAAAAPPLLLGAALLLGALAHGAHAALALRRPRHRAAALALVGIASLGALCGLCGLGVWVYGRVWGALQSAEGRRLAEVGGALQDHLGPLLRTLTRLHLLPEHFTKVIDEASADLPYNAYLAAAAAALLAALLALTATLALLAAKHAATHLHRKGVRCSAERERLRPAAAAAVHKQIGNGLMMAARRQRPTGGGLGAVR